MRVIETARIYMCGSLRAASMATLIFGFALALSVCASDDGPHERGMRCDGPPGEVPAPMSRAAAEMAGQERPASADELSEQQGSNNLRGGLGQAGTGEGGHSLSTAAPDSCDGADLEHATDIPRRSPPRHGPPTSQ